MALPLLVALFGCVDAVAEDKTDFIVQDIKVEGLQRISAGTIFNYLKIKVGEKYSTETGQQAIRGLYKTGFFKDIKLSRQDSILVVTVVERPSISEIKLEGMEEVTEEDLRKGLKQVGFAEGRVYNRSLLEKVETEIKRQYFSLGRYSIKTESTITPLERNLVSINIKILEGKVARIREINIIGNTQFDDDEILDRMDLSEPGWFTWFTSSDKYAREKLIADQEAIKSYYQDNGYMKFAIESTQVSITPDKENIYITINVKEGKKYTLGKYKIAGKFEVPEEEIRKFIDIEEGEVYSRKKITNITKSITDYLGSKGFAFSNVNPIPEIDEENSIVEFTFFVEPGKRVYVRRIEFSGNTNTTDETLRREMRQEEGGWFSTTNISRSRIRLQRLGFFDEVNIDTPKVAGTVDQVDVKVGVKERPTGNLLFGVGYSDSDGVLVNGSITESNVFGSGRSVSVSFDNSQSTTSLRANYTNPYFTDSGILGGLSLYATQVDAEEANTAPYILSTSGGGAFFRFPISEERSIRNGLYYEVTDVSVSDDGAQIAKDFVEKHGERNGAFKVTLGWSQDSLDSALFPSSGQLYSVSLESTVPGSELEYYRANVELASYIPFTKTVTFRTKLEYSYGDGFGDTETLPFFKNYFAGGSNTVRGFRARYLGPRDQATEQPVGGNKRILGNAELFFPMVGLDQDNKAMRLSLFVDGGMVYAPEQDIDAEQIRYSAGLAFNWFSPVGPMSISYGLPFEEKEGDKLETVQFTIGVPFR